MKQKHTLIAFLFAILFLNLTSCENEEESVITQLTLLEQMQQNFNAQDFTETLYSEYTVDWNNTPKQYSKELETSFYEFPLTYTSSLNPDALNKQKQEGYYIHHRLIATVNESDEFKFYMAKFYQEINENTQNSSYNISINVDSGFKVIIQMFDKENDMVYAKRIEENLIKNNPILLKKEFGNNDMASRVIEECIDVTTELYKDWYKVIDGVAYYTSTQYLGSTTEEVCDSYWLPNLNTSGGGGGGLYQVIGSVGIYDDCVGSDCKYDIDDEEEPFFVFEVEHPIEDVEEFLECFDTDEEATLTIYTLEPNPGSGDRYTGGWLPPYGIGHTYVSISQGGNTSTYGYYPTEADVRPILNIYSDAVLGDDGSGNGLDHFSASISITISGSELEDIIDASIDFNSNYNLNTYNCTDFAIDIGNLGGLNLPAANGSWPGGSGSNPGTLGLWIRNLTPPQGTTTSSNNGTGTPDETDKDCN